MHNREEKSDFSSPTFLKIDKSTGRNFVGNKEKEPRLFLCDDYLISK